MQLDYEPNHGYEKNYWASPFLFSSTKLSLACNILFVTAGLNFAMYLPPAKSAPSSSIDSKLITSQSKINSTQLKVSSETTTLKTGTESTTLKTGTESTTLQTGTESTTLQTGAESTLLQGATNGSLIQGTVEHEGVPINILFLFDASHSMKEKFGGQEKKINAAKQVLESALSRIPSDVNLGLRVFGQGFSGLPELDCRQTALLVPIGKGNRRTIVDKVRRIEPFGMTPLEYALRQAAEDDFRDVRGIKTLILITDGADTCGGNPCRYIRTLPYRGIKLKVDVVGLDLKKDPAARSQLNCVAEGSGGKYYDANSAAELIDSISKSVSKAISGKVLMHTNQSLKNPETPAELIPILPEK